MGSDKTPSPCPCGHDVLEIGESFFGDRFEITCPKCGRTTDECETMGEAIRSWNAHPRREHE